MVQQKTKSLLLFSYASKSSGTVISKSPAYCFESLLRISGVFQQYSKGR